jgi:hypothetical protein
MITHTKAYERFRQVGIVQYDFCVLVSFAIPCLDKQIKPLSGPVAGKIPKSKYIKNDNITAEELQRRIGLAGDSIGKELLLSTFSYFEAYVADALKEILAFHGGAERIAEMAKSHDTASSGSCSAAVVESQRKLLDVKNPAKHHKYKKHLRVLRNEGYPLPSQRLSCFGWLSLANRLKRMKSHEIPDLLFDGLLYPLSQSDRDTFHSLRDKRNKIAHGKLTRYPVRTAVTHGKFLRDLAVGIDKYLVKNFLMIEYPSNEL